MARDTAARAIAQVNKRTRTSANAASGTMKPLWKGERKTALASDKCHLKRSRRMVEVLFFGKAEIRSNAPKREDPNLRKNVKALAGYPTHGTEIVNDRAEALNVPGQRGPT